MSNGRSLRRAVEKRVALDAARYAGCICEPHIHRHGAAQVTVQHDSWCPIVDHVTQVVIYRPPGCDR